jgi:hypothetical protein
MDGLLAAIKKNPFRESCVTAFTKSDLRVLEAPGEKLWGRTVTPLTPARLMTAYLMTQDPLMVIAGEGYRATEVREKSFALQEDASSLRGNRKLTKAKVGDALSSLNPDEDQTKVIATILLALKQVQTVCYDEEKKTVWTVPEDLRAWSRGRQTVWINSRYDAMLEGPPFASWLADRDHEGWTIDWPIAEGTFEDIKARAAQRGLVPKPAFGATKTKKDDWAKALGRAEAIEHLG